MTYVAAEQIHQSITLYRGDHPALRQRILIDGVGGTIGSIDQLRLVRLPIDLVAHLGYPEIARHVISGSRGSPFTSWSESREMATWYALDGGRRARGILLQVTLRLRRRASWDNPDGTWSVGYQDARGRQLIPTAGFGALTARAVSSPEEIATIRALGNTDQEHLVLGRIDPYEITIEDVPRPRPSPRRGFFGLFG